MRALARIVVVLVCAAGTFVAPVARADVAPPSACWDEGATCDNAGGDGGQTGVCSTATCTRNTGDGGAMSYECLLCKKAAPGAGGEAGAPVSAGGAGGMGAGGADAGSATGGANPALGGAPAEAGNAGVAAATGAAGSPAVPGGGDGDDAGCSCSFKELGTERGIVTLMLGLGLAAVGVSRRRRR